MTNSQIKVERATDGFTLVEVVAALVLSTMVMAIVLGLSTRIAKTNKRLVEERPDKSWQSILVDSLQTDFENCRSVTVERYELKFSGYSIPRSEFQGNKFEIPVGHVPSRVTYKTVETDGESWLVRTVSFPQERAGKSSTILAKGVEYFRTMEFLQTDVAPPVLRLELYGPVFGATGSLQVNMVRHGGVEL